MRKIDELVLEYTEINEKIKKLKKEKEIYKEKIASYMHSQKVNQIDNIPGYNDQKFTCKYMDRERKKADFELLAEIVTSSEYNKIVAINTTSALTIRKTPKKKTKKKLTNQAPNKSKNTIDLEIPMGELN